jgi:hypothetical protein
MVLKAESRKPAAVILLAAALNEKGVKLSFAV